MTLLAMSCGGDDTAEPAAPADVADGGVLKVAVHALPPSQGYPFTTIGVPAVYVWTPLFDALTEIDEDNVAQPSLATEWESVDATTWRFTLREGVTFSNEEILDAEAVAFTINYLKTDAEARTSAVSTSLLPTVTEARVVDELTVDIVSSPPDPILPSRLAQVYIVPPEYLQEVGADEFATAPIGSGPFKVVSWEPGRVVYEAYGDSWHPPEHLDGLEITEIAESTARLQALQSGQAHIAVRLSPDQISQVEEAGMDAVIDQGAVAGALAFFTEGPDSPVADVRVRQALNYAVDKQAIVDGLYQGLATVASQSATPNTFGYDPSIEPYPYDPDRARDLLAEAGYPDGFEATLDIVLADQVTEQMTQLIVEDLAEVGVDLQINNIPFSEWFNRYQTNGWSGPLFGLGYVNDPFMDAIRPYTIYSCLKQPAFFCDEDAMPLIEEATSAFDRDEREAALQELMQYTHENPPSLFTVNSVDISGSHDVVGFRYLYHVINYREIGLRG